MLLQKIQKSKSKISKTFRRW